ncbi:MAG TPA: hypothetical protein PKC39_03755 [Ferruginibacter sp.]|nr:hypothetical protein [Ferruginibacter sp.]HMP20054.1 hypothetical protein [Ferruginibacter sp.]
MRKVIFLSVVFTALAVAKVSAQKSSGQDYTTALGVKFYPGAVTLKHFLNSDNKALEGIGYFWDRGFRITGLYEIHGDIKDVSGLKWYIGPGAHVGFYNNKFGGGTSIGVDGVIGLDYKFNDAPINISLDWQPSFEFGNNYGNGFAGNFGGLSIRYTLK